MRCTFLCQRLLRIAHALCNALPEVCCQRLRLSIVHVDHGLQQRHAADVQEAREGFPNTYKRLVQAASLRAAEYGVTDGFLRVREYGDSINIWNRVPWLVSRNHLYSLYIRHNTLLLIEIHDYLSVYISIMKEVTV